jgi:hypothetical protein
VGCAKAPSNHARVCAENWAATSPSSPLPVTERDRLGLACRAR